MVILDKPYYINGNYEILDEKEDRLILKNKQSEQLIRLSFFEYELIEQFTRLGSINALFQYYNKIAQVSYGDLISLISLAIQYKIIATDKVFDEEVRDKKSLWVYHLFQRVFPGQSKIKPELKGSFIVYKLLSFDVSKSWLGRGFAKPLYPTLLLLLILVPLIFLLPALLRYGVVDFKSIFKSCIMQVPVSYSKLTLIIQLVMCLTWCFHEMGHYTLYKVFKGKSNEFGLGLLFYFLPIVYTSTNSVYLWNSRTKRFLVSAGGILFDLILVVYALIFITRMHQTFPTCTYVLFMIIFSVGYRTCYNLLVFLPGSDGYYIFSDLLGIEQLYSKAIGCFYKIIKTFGQLNVTGIKQLHLKEYLGFLYYCLAFVVVLITRLLMFISIGFMIYNWGAFLFSL